MITSSYSKVITILILFSVMLILPQSVKSDLYGAKRPFRTQGGWTLNSVGYNGGLGALQKFFGKRNNMSFGNKNEFVESSDLNYIIKEFMVFLKMRESGMTNTQLERCLVNFTLQTAQGQ